MKFTFVFNIFLTFISTSVILFSDLVSCTTSGLISPIEVVEEWGCHDTEIRLTCAHLDSKIAVLEATFTPNCSQPDCLRLDIRRLSKVFAPQKTDDPRKAEAEAGRKFLETLRKTHPLDEDEMEDNNTKTGEYGLKDNETTMNIDDDLRGKQDEENISPKTDRLKEKKTNSLRASLERLIIRYLRQLSPEEDINFQSKRSWRSKRSFGTDEENDSIDDDGTNNNNNNNHNNNNKKERIILGEKNITINESDIRDIKEEKERESRLKETRSFCPEQKRKAASMDRSDIERSFKNESDEEYNIRRIVNRRCSGKNHCSFIFSVDHPFSKVWQGGVVRIKYLCMEDFRLNHYCGEHLTIGNEVGVEQEENDISTTEPPRGEPVAEARTQLREPGYHSLKIIRTSDDHEETHGSRPFSSGSSAESKKRKIKAQNKSAPLKEESQDEIKGVYSQDFRVLKILPSNLDDFNDIEKIGDEIYFRTDDKNLEEPAPTAFIQTTRHTTREISTTQDTIVVPQPIPSHSTTTSSSPTSSIMSDLIENDIGNVPKNTKPGDNRNNINSYDNINTNSRHRMDDEDLKQYENITMIIREGEQYIVTFPKPKILDNLFLNGSYLKPVKATSFPPSEGNNIVTEPVNYIIASSSLETLPDRISPSSATENLTTMHQPEFIIKNVDFSPTVEDDFDNIDEDDEAERNMIEKEINNIETQDMSAESTNKKYGKVGNENRIIEDVENIYGDVERDDLDSTEFEEDEDRRSYTSIQRTYYGKPLLHGFTMTPGYPKFYIGDSECKWIIDAPAGQKIRLNILDLSLRYEPECTDYLKIADLEHERSLFNSCTESIRPLEVISFSNKVEIIVKTVTKFAYPKRGVLIHYSALGCINPPPPKNGRMINRTETTASYECDPSYVFPDSGVNRRQLVCTEKHSWDRNLPNCVEELALAGSGTLFGLNLNSHRRISNKTSVGTPGNNMSNKDPDLIYDIIVPLLLIAALFIVNAIVFVIILKYRRRSKGLERDNMELAEL